MEARWIVELMDQDVEEVMGPKSVKSHGVLLAAEELGNCVLLGVRVTGVAFPLRLPLMRHSSSPQVLSAAARTSMFSQINSFGDS